MASITFLSVLLQQVALQPESSVPRLHMLTSQHDFHFFILKISWGPRPVWLLEAYISSSYPWLVSRKTNRHNVHLPTFHLCSSALFFMQLPLIALLLADNPASLSLPQLLVSVEPGHSAFLLMISGDTRIQLEHFDTCHISIPVLFW